MNSFLPEDYKPDNLSENLYYCIYDLDADEFDAIFTQKKEKEETKVENEVEKK